MKTGVEEIMKERMEMLEKHNRTVEDDKHNVGSFGLAEAAAVCASPRLIYNKKDYANQFSFIVPDVGSWKLPLKWNGNVLLSNAEATKEERIHQLRVAGALCAAAIDVINLEA